ncbi:hypothetical protein K439DRAFT_1626352 [Ramaria rubella]|nr:hypothetical protein K439DRAFT_1626352 [Ramaria rubella]
MAAQAEKLGDPPRRTRVKHVVAQPQRRDLGGLANLDGYLNDLSLDNGNILAASNAYSTSAQNVRTNADDSSRQDALTNLLGFQHSLDPLVPLFSNIGADKGLANYQRSDQTETLLKDIINANKNVLSDTNDIVNKDPLLGPMLGPIVYDIKCILDELLDATENITDGLLNGLGPLLSPLISDATSTMCQSMAPSVAGLCL